MRCAIAPALPAGAEVAYFRVRLQGKGIEMPVGAKLATGFFVTRYIRAKTKADAVPLAMRMVASQWLDRHKGAKAPEMELVQADPISFFEGVLARQPGYTLCSESYEVLARSRFGD
jgi:hypothetical protein